MLAAFRGAVAALAVLFAGVGSAQDLPKQHFKVLGGFSNINFARTIERPFWVQKLPEASKGSIGAEFTTLDQMGLQGTEVMRLIRLGVVDFASGNLSYMASDSPVFDSLDLPGVYLDLPALRKSVDAYKPVLERVAAQRFNAKLLAIWPVPPQVLYCRQAIGGLADLKGKKVRSFSPALADFIAAVGGTPVQIAFPEVVPSLQRGAVDCGVTGTLSGNTAKWWEVTTHLYPLVVGWAPWFTAVNLNTWNRLDARTREFLLTQYAGLEKDYWDNTAKEAQDGINCNTGQGDCVFGTKGAMKLVPVSDADKATLAQVASEVVLKKWAARCGADCAREWTATVGKVVGLSADGK
jgi:TRAP-type C4-dicarboxylate transport system substrate-binding protein